MLCSRPYASTNSRVIQPLGRSGFAQASTTSVEAPVVGDSEAAGRTAQRPARGKPIDLDDRPGIGGEPGDAASVVRHWEQARPVGGKKRPRLEVPADPTPDRPVPPRALGRATAKEAGSTLIDLARQGRPCARFESRTRDDVGRSHVVDCREDADHGEGAIRLGVEVQRDGVIVRIRRRRHPPSCRQWSPVSPAQAGPERDRRPPGPAPNSA